MAALINKEMLIATANSKSSSSQSLVGIVTRLSEQKGIELLFNALTRLEGAGLWPIALVNNGCDEPLAHLIEGAAIFFSCPRAMSSAGLN